MTERSCKECKHSLPDGAKSCENCGALVTARSPLIRLVYFYFAGGLAFIGLYIYLFDIESTKSLVFRWLAVGFSLALIVYGRSKRHASAVAGLLYLVGLAVLVILLLTGIYLVWDQGIAIPVLRKQLG